MSESQVSSGRQGNAEKTIRSAVVVRPRQPFVDWLRSVEELEVPTITLEQLDKTVYLVPDYEDPNDAEKVLRRVSDDIFCRELYGWYTDESMWPKDRSWRVFKAWFDIEHFDVIEDLVAAPLEYE